MTGVAEDDLAEVTGDDSAVIRVVENDPAEVTEYDSADSSQFEGHLLWDGK